MSGRERLSVAIATYNGEAYLAEQLESIAGQTRVPDELVVCDDRSSDGTAEVVREFARRAGFPVRFHANEARLGSTRNFERAISLCTGTLIALADQDDAWMPGKAAALEAAFARRPGAGLVFSEGLVASERLAPTGVRLSASFGFTPAMQRQVNRGGAFQLLLRRNLVTGAAMAFRATLRPLVLPIPQDAGVIHDGWIALVAAAVSELVFLPEPLLLYRQHATQQVGAYDAAAWRPGLGARVKSAWTADRDGYLSRAGELEVLRGRLQAHRDVPGAAGAARVVEAMIANLRARGTLPRARLRRVPRVAREAAALRYHRFAEGLASAAKDLLSP